MSERLLKRILKHEGFRQFPYFDCCGKPFRQCKCAPQGILTIGHGRNLESVGIRYEESVYLAKNDIKAATDSAYRLIRDFGSLDEVRQDVVIDMIFNLGPAGFMGFKKMIAALAKRDFEGASREMLDSDWYRQVGVRAEKLAEAMKTGKFPEGE